MISKQHFIRAAEIVNNIRQGHWTKEPCAFLTAKAFICLFSDYNPRFDTQRFLIACGLVAAPVKAKRSRKAA